MKVEDGLKRMCVGIRIGEAIDWTVTIVKSKKRGWLGTSARRSFGLSAESRGKLRGQSAYELILCRVLVYTKH